MGEGKLTSLTTPLNRQSPKIAHVITSTISPQATFGQDGPRGYVSPYSQNYHSIFYISFFVRKTFPGCWTDFVTRYINRRVFTQGSPFWGLKDNNFTSSPSKPPKTPFLGTYNGKPMGNTYSHNCTMHTRFIYDAEIWRAVLPCQVLWAHIKVSAYGVRQGAGSPEIKLL